MKRAGRSSSEQVKSFFVFLRPTLSQCRSSDSFATLEDEKGKFLDEGGKRGLDFRDTRARLKNSFFPSS